MSGVGWAVLTAVAIAVALGVSKPIGRWLTRQLRETFTEVVNEAVAPRFATLEQKMDDVQTQNSADHGAVVKRLSAVEVELALLTERVAALEPKEQA